MKTVLAMTNNVNSCIKLVLCKTKDEAIKKMETEYRNLCDKIMYDYDNTYIDTEDGYAQVVEGLRQIEFRVGQIV